MTYIEINLKTKMIMKAREVKLVISVGEKERLVHTFNEINLKWKNDSLVETATKINDIINGHFEECHRYEYYMENEIMKQFNWKYSSSNDIVKDHLQG